MKQTITLLGCALLFTCPAAICQNAETATKAAPSSKAIPANPVTPAIPQTDNERLLADVFGESSGAGFPEAMLAGTLQLARRRRRVRQVRRAGSGVALIILVAVFWRSLTPPVTKPEVAMSRPPSSACSRITTQPLAPGRIVSTRLQSFVPFGNVAKAATVVRTVPGGFDEIGDDELLALAAPPVVALVRRGPREAELVFVPATEDMPPQD